MLDPHPPTVDELRRQTAGTPEGDVLERALTATLREVLDQLFVDTRVKTIAANGVLGRITSLDEPGAMFSAAALSPGRLANPAIQGIPEGGMGTLSAALASAAEQAGASIRTGARVSRILVEDGKATGVALADGQHIAARVVVSNAHPRTTFGLIDSGVAEAAVHRVDQMDTDYASMKFHAIVDELPDFSRWLGPDFDPKAIAHVTICPDLDYFEAALAEARAHAPTTHPLIAMQIPTVYDTTLAPPGHHIVSLWVRLVPTKPKDTSWAAIRDQEGQKLIDVLTSYAPNFRRSIIDWLLYTPDDIETRVGLIGGNIHHLTHSRDQMLGDRGFGGGGYETPVGNLYLCGASTHPGGEVTCAPGHNAAITILKKYGRVRLAV